MLERLAGLAGRLEEIDRLLADPAIGSDPDRLRDLARERAELVPLVEGYQRLRAIEQELGEARELLDDPEMREVAREEIAALEAEREEVTGRLRVLLLPRDPFEGRNLLLEIRAGTGGDEAALFAGDLFRMYQRYCDRRGWRFEVLSSSTVAVGGGGGRVATGFKEVVCQVRGEEAYAHLKFESGVHRVQRVPLTESQGRIHTSAATVAVLPEPEAVEVHLDEKDLRIDVFRASGPGGQSVNTTDSAVRITHLPTGLVVICQDEKSQHKNRAKAMKVLQARLFERQQAERQAAEAAERRAQVGSGDRSERIRTYNFPQNRVTDHRVGLTLYKLDQVMEGHLDLLVEPLVAHFQAEALARHGLG